MAKVLAFLQKAVSQFRALILGVATTAVINLVASFGFHLSADAVAVVSSILSAAIAWFVGEHFAAQLAAAKAAKK